MVSRVAVGISAARNEKGVMLSRVVVGISAARNDKGDDGE